ncbi:MAG: hypothetical protein A2Y77_05425 [Planctomycetes bacterium RBG_13_62_9]|nr:MAG: hypothetical protein A2Y77_05425 [Planctomycetes bacterium RBG_13_62_9]
MTTFQPTQRDRRSMAVVAAVAGILSFTVLPFAVVQAMDAVLKGAAVEILASGNPLIATAPRIVLTFFPVWGGLSVAAGVALLLVAWAIYRGEGWARPVAIGLLAIPSITGAFFSGPIMYFGKSAMPLFLLIALIGLVPYFTLLLRGKEPLGSKLGTFFLFLMLGVTAAWSFSNGGSSLRMFMARAEPYVLTGGQYGFLMGIPVVWIGFLSTIVAIPLLAARTRLGWRLALVGLATILVGSIGLFATHLGTIEFLIGIILAIVTLILLVLPSTRGRLEVRTA